MNKLILSSVLCATVMNGISWAQEDKPGVSDLTQPRPPATVTATNLATVVKTKTEQQGVTVEETEDVIFKEPTSVAKVNTPETALPPPEIFDNNLDLEKTMEIMGKNFKALKKAESTDEMVEPLARLIRYASQAQALGGTMHEAKRIDYEMGIQQLRINLAELEASVQANDLAQAKILLEDIDENRKESHEYFDVD